MYQAMTVLGHAQESTYSGPIQLEGDPQGAKVLVLGAGLAGMTAALELRAAGYQVEVLEYREKAGGRCWTLRSGDTYTELGGATQTVDFAEGNYINPGPWRIPHHHYALLDYCKRLNVELEPFIQQNYNAYLHRSDAFDGEPQRFRKIATDYRGQVHELLAKAVNQGRLDEAVTEDDKQALLESLRVSGILNENYEYVESLDVSEYRGFDKDPGGGVNAAPLPSTPIDLSTILDSRLWTWLATHESLHHQNPMFQPVGGMDMIAQAFAREVGDLITYNAKVVSLQQDDDGVTVEWEDLENGGTQTSTADWCVCTIPFSILGQIDHNLSSELSSVIDGMFYNGSVKWGLEFNRRFWEQDEHIYGGITYTDLPITQISYPSTGYLSEGPAVLLGGYTWRGAESFEFNAMPPEERVQWAVEYGSRIHPQYTEEFKTGVCVTWHRVPWVLGCSGVWENRERDYEAAVQIDRRVVCAGEHLSYLPAWQEGAILSSLDAITRLHEKVVNG